MDNGWIKLYRSSIQNPAFQKPYVWHYFQYCLLKANHIDRKILFNSLEIVIERGCFITGRREASKETGLSEQSIRTALLVLQNMGMVEKSTSKSTSKYTYIKICNYDSYQQQENISNQQINQQLTSNQPATNQQLTTNNNDKNVKNDKNNTTLASIEKITFDFSTSKFLNLNGKIEKYKEKYPAVNVDSEILKMEAWLMSHPNNRKSQYMRFINSWLSRAQDNARGQPIKETIEQQAVRLRKEMGEIL